MVLRHVHELHFSRNEDEYDVQLAECFHTPSGFATTNNPCETYNASLKRDVTLRRKLKVGALMDRLLILCQAESVRALPILTAPACDDRLVRRSNALAHAGLLRECRPCHNSVAFLLGNTADEEIRKITNVIALPAPKIYDVHEKRSREDLPVTARLGVESARMEHLDMPLTGWEVDLAARS
ncbi:hypothetical protein PR003_g7108 [Phytophthora rubi]|uniref:Uncharacterized protein n=1 Tax=Phytophthora rubi TaxID=129364 RepID=A0A6A3NHV9_9STRA|nr:hypothetical protein PR002_g2446 [Phytophthora rubi]KAE9347092.1 hypothetical protein PR003_g7108 [Phytophthora rubi]